MSPVPVQEPIAPPELPEPQLARTQSRVSPPSKSPEPADYTQPSAPKGIEIAKRPTVKGHVPKFTIKDGFEKLAAKLRPDMKDPVKQLFHRHINTDSKKYPYCTIGKIFVGKNRNFASTIWTGIGVLVGKDLVLTASHTVPWNTPGGWMRFVPGYEDGHEPFGSSYIEHWHGYIPEPATAFDYAICKLFTPLGEKVGWMGSYGWTADSSYKKHVYQLIGYSSHTQRNQVQVIDQDVPLQNIADDFPNYKALMTAYLTSGWKGGILWTWIGDSPYVVGILSDSTDEWVGSVDGEYSVFSGGVALPLLVKWGQSNW